MREESEKLRKISEDEILTIVKKFCNPDKKGDWVATIDIVEAKDGLKLTENEESSKCKQECKSIAKACEESIGETGTDL